MQFVFPLASRGPSEFDPAKCGLDAVLHINSAIPRVISQRLSARSDLRTGAVVYADESCRDLSTLAELYTPLSPPQTTGTDLKALADCAADLKAFASKLLLLREIDADAAFSDGECQRLSCI